jgi:hypothetical protein
MRAMRMRAMIGVMAFGFAGIGARIALPRAIQRDGARQDGAEQREEDDR